MNFQFEGHGKCPVVVQHSKLVDARQAERMKKYWGEQLKKLKEVVSSQLPVASERPRHCFIGPSSHRAIELLRHWRSCDLDAVARCGFNDPMTQ